MTSAAREAQAEAMLGKTVKVLPPFGHSFSGEYKITAYMLEDKIVQYELDGAPGWFAAHFLELV